VEAKPAAGGARISRLGLETLASTIVVYGLALVAGILIARALGPAGRGRYHLPVTLATLAVLVGSWGLDQAQRRSLGSGTATRDELVATALAAGAGLGTAAALAAWALFSWNPGLLFDGVRPADMAIVAVMIPPQVHCRLLNSLLVLGDRLRASNAVRILAAAVQTTIAVCLAGFGLLTVEAVLVLYAATNLLLWGSTAAAVRGFGRVRHVAWSTVRTELWVGTQLQPAIVLAHLNLRADVFFVAWYASLHEVGLYAVAVTVSELVWLPTDAVASAVAARQTTAPAAEAVDATMRAVRMSLVVGLLVALALAIAAPAIVGLLYGAAFRPAVPAVWALLAASVAMAVWRPIGGALLRLAPPHVQSVIAGVALLVNVGLNVLLIPRIGIVGAGLASVASYVAGATLAAGFFLRGHRLGVAALIPTRDELTDLVALGRVRSR